MQRLDWKRIQKIEFDARKLNLDNRFYNESMIFLLDCINTLREQNETLQEQLNNLYEDDISRSSES